MTIKRRLGLVSVAWTAVILAGLLTGAQASPTSGKQAKKPVVHRTADESNLAQKPNSYVPDAYAKGQGSYKPRVLFTLKWGKAENRLGLTIDHEEVGRIYGPGLIYVYHGLIVIPDPENKRLVAFKEDGKVAWSIKGLPIHDTVSDIDNNLVLGLRSSLYKVDIGARKIVKLNYSTPEWLKAAAATDPYPVIIDAVHFSKAGNTFFEISGREGAYTIECDQNGHYVRHYDMRDCSACAQGEVCGISQVRVVNGYDESVIARYSVSEGSPVAETVLRIPDKNRFPEVTATGYWQPMMIDEHGNFYIVAQCSSMSGAVYKFGRDGKWLATLGGKYLPINKDIYILSFDTGTTPVAVNDNGDVYILVTERKGASVIKYEYIPNATSEPGNEEAK